MHTIDFYRQDYDLRIEASVIYECALHIAAYTRPEIHAHVEPTVPSWSQLTERLSPALRQEVDLAGQVHTWRSILFLAHRCETLRDTPLTRHLDVFLSWLNNHRRDLVPLAAPTLDSLSDIQLQEAVDGNEDAQEVLLHRFQGNPLVEPNLRYLFSVTSDELYRHVETLLAGWYREAVPEPDRLMEVLRKEVAAKRAAAATMPVSDLIRRVLRGGEFVADVDVRTVCLIPQVAYRPFTILNKLPRTSVLYYPVADENLADGTDQQTMMDIAAVHKAIGDVHRVRILHILKAAPTTVTDLAATLDLAKSTVHHHLTLLRTSGLVTIQQGLYTLNESRILTYPESLRNWLGIREDSI